MTKRRVRESAPIQVYLDAADHERLEQLAEQFATTKSAILRRGLVALQRETLDPDNHPALRMIGLAPEETAAPTRDAAREHDELLAHDEEASWSAPATRKIPRRGR